MALTPITPVEAAPGIPDPENRITFSSLMYGLLHWIVDEMAPGVNDLAQATHDNADEALNAASTATGAAVAANNLKDAAATSATAAGNSASAAFGYAESALDAKAAANASAASAAASASSVDSAYLRNRANHTGTQAISTITGLSTALDELVQKQLVAGTDLNTVVTSGFYRVNTGHTNTPIQTDVGYSTLVVAYAGDTGFQMVTQYSTGRVFTRTGSGNGTTWTPWIELAMHRSKAISLTGTTLDLSAATDYYKSISANTTITLSNAGAAGGLAQASTLIVNHTGGTITLTGATIKWAGGSAPTLTTGRVHQFFFWPDPITNQVLVSGVSYY